MCCDLLVAEMRAFLESQRSPVRAALRPRVEVIADPLAARREGVRQAAGGTARCGAIPDVRTLADVPTLPAHQFWSRCPDVGPDVDAMGLPDLPRASRGHPRMSVRWGRCPDIPRCGYT
jgi:hypothetical protein